MRKSAYILSLIICIVSAPMTSKFERAFAEAAHAVAEAPSPVTAPPPAAPANPSQWRTVMETCSSQRSGTKDSDAITEAGKLALSPM